MTDFGILAQLLYPLPTLIMTKFGVQERTFGLLLHAKFQLNPYVTHAERKNPKYCSFDCLLFPSPISAKFCLRDCTRVILLHAIFHLD